MRLRVMVPLVVILIVAFVGIGVMVTGNVSASVDHMVGSQMTETLDVVSNQLSLTQELDQLPSSAGIGNAKQGIINSYGTQAVVANITVGQTGGVFVLNQQSIIVANKDTVFIGTDLSAFPEVVAAGGQQEASFTFEYGGTPVLAQSKAYAEGTIVAYLPVSELDGYKKTPIFVTILFGVVCLAVLANLLYALLSRYMVTPLEKLNNNVLTLEESGAIDEGALHKSPEITELGSNINDMLKRLNMSDTRIHDLQVGEINLQTRLKQQELMARLTENFVSLDNLQQLISNSLKRVGDFMGVSRIVLSINDQQGGLSSLSGCWHAKDVAPVTSLTQDRERLVFSSFPNQQPDDQIVLPVYCNDATTVERYRSFGTGDPRSFIWAPLYVGGRLMAALSIEQCEEPREWANNDLQLVRLFSNIIATSLSRSQEQGRGKHLDDLLTASNKIANVLLNPGTGTLGDTISRCLGLMGKATGTNRVTLWTVAAAEQQTHCAALSQWWDTEENSTRAGQLENIPFTGAAPAWLDGLRDGKGLKGQMEQLPADLRSVLEPQGLVLAMMIPLMVRNTFWGFVEFADFSYQQEYSDGEVSVLRSGCLLIAEVLGKTVPVERPAEPPVEQPVEPPVVQVIEQPVEPPVEPPVVQVIEQPVVQPVVQVIEPPVVQPVVQPVEPPVVQVIEQPIEPPVVQPVAQPVEPPIVQPTEPPVAQPIVQPVAPPVEQPVAPPVAQPVEELPAPPPVQAIVSWEGTVVLVAENAAGADGKFVAQLEAMGLTVAKASNGKELLDVFMAGPRQYQMTFIDLDMPEMNGLETTYRLRNLPLVWGKEIPIVVTMNTHASNENAQKCFKVGATECVGKPLDPAQISALLQKHLT